jgi:outer membrane lipoprotein-sorting protein
MKKVLILLALSLTIAVSAQKKITKGIIISKQTMSSDNEQANQQFAMMGDMKTTTFFKGTKSRSELSNPMSGDVVTVTDSKTGDILILMENPMLGKKYMQQKIKITAEDLKNIKVTVTGKTKVVLGYTCKQYIVSVNKDGQTVEMDLFTTEAISISSQQTAMLANKVKGFPLYSVMKMNQMGVNMTVTTEVTEIKKDAAVDDKKFSLTPPEGYEKMN